MKPIKAVIYTKHYETMKSKVPSYELYILGRRIIDYPADALIGARIDEVEVREEGERIPGLNLYISASAALVTVETVEKLISKENSCISDGENLLAFYADDKHLSLTDKEILASPDFTELPVHESERFSVTTRQGIVNATAELQRRINGFHLENGVTIVKPDTAFISPGVVIGCDTTIFPNTTLFGECEIGENCVIGPNVSMTDMILGDNVTVADSTLISSEIGAYTEVGPYAYVRPGSKIGSHAKIGDFVEIKNSSVGDYSKASHLAYIGDSDVGSHVNFGCGAVTVNYDGSKKHRTIVRDNAFIGCNTNLVSPVTIGEGAYTAAGSTITDDVPESSLAIARARQVHKPGWALNRRKK